MPRNGKTVLLVEDNEDNRIVYSTILRHFGYDVIEALNGEEGISKARSEQPDLILMDISIPIIDGWEATQVLKHDPATRDIPIIALTAHALASDREKAMEVGCDGYLAKPCDAEVLEIALIAAARISALHREQRTAQLQQGHDVRRDAQTHSARTAGRTRLARRIAFPPGR